LRQIKVAGFSHEEAGTLGYKASQFLWESCSQTNIRKAGNLFLNSFICLDKKFILFSTFR
jgi:hypothetical protein